MTERRPDYFSPAATPALAALRRAKGNTRRTMIAAALERGEPLSSIPEEWLQHDLPDFNKALLQQMDPQARGGEDLPDLLEGEVEVARITLVDSVHGEVTSLRARRSGKRGIRLSLVDEYETEFRLLCEQLDQPPTEVELLHLLAAAEPCPLRSSCQLRLDSVFYPALDATADRLQVKQHEEVC